MIMINLIAGIIVFIALLVTTIMVIYLLSDFIANNNAVNIIANNTAVKINNYFILQTPWDKRR